MRIGRFEIKYQGRRFTIDGGWIVRIAWYGPFEWQTKVFDALRMTDSRPVPPPSLDTILKP